MSRQIQASTPDDHLVSRDALRAGVERAMAEESARHTRVMHELRIRYNTLAPFSQLPQEILAKILVENSRRVDAAFRDDLSKRPVPPQTEKYYDWLATAQVCRQWRAVALGFPKLWSSILITKPKWVAEMLRRSQSVPLTVTVRFPAHGEEANTQISRAFERVLRELHRIQHINIHVSSQINICMTMHGPAPLLESVSFWDFRPRSSPLSDVINDQAPRLQSLQFTGRPTSWNTQSFPSTLKHLALLNTKSSRNGLLRAEDVPVIFGRLQCLESLKLSHVLERRSGELGESSPPTRTTHLPRLRTIEISESNPLDGLHFLDQLSYSSDSFTLVNGSFFSDAFTNSAFVQVASKLRSYCTLSITETTHVQRNLPMVCFHAANATAPGCAAFELSLVKHSTATSTIVAGVCRNLGPSQVEALQLNELSLPVAVWHQALGSMRALTSLHVKGQSTPHLPQALVRRLAGSADDSGPGDYLLPALREVRMQQVAFTAEMAGAWRECALDRCAYGAKINWMVFDHCSHVNASDVRLLGVLVDSVEWDGVGG
ncbi:hypothetical protein B0H21DRAFT_721419 [Amylocystis lapponica]|nr:hypothetical protein B0H21DRAFT_721419 [Amylocystis lapponica]